MRRPADLIVVSDGGTGASAPAFSLLQGFDTATQITALAHCLRHQPSPRSGRPIGLPPDPVNAASCFAMPCASDRCPQTGRLWGVGLQALRGLVQ